MMGQARQMTNFDNLTELFSTQQGSYEKSGIFSGSELLQSLKVPSTLPVSNYLREGWQQLIVIGNGFDLECGLKTRYSDFFDPRRDKVYPSQDYLETHGQTWRGYIKENAITVWDVILEECADGLWNNIEKAIESWVVPGHSSHFQRLLGLLNTGIESDFTIKEKSFPWKEYVGKTDADIIEVPVARFILQTVKGRRKSWNEERLYGYLREQLGILESEFKIYLDRQVAQSESYSQKSWQLIWDLLAPGYPLGGDKDPITTVLNFNYTNPTTQKSLGLPLRTINVHGEIPDEIVFGIDGKDYLGNRFVAPFTKTYRILGLHSKKRLSLFKNVVTIANDSAPLDVIKFYGHSLSESDYSYFQAIFDEVNLYSGNTELVFYYRKHAGTLDAQAEMSESVSRLLSEYGRTMDNVDHGKNLMHKLILEGRLSVLELEKQKTIKQPKQMS